mgnify:CR=1 FL=1
MLVHFFVFCTVGDWETAAHISCSSFLRQNQSLALAVHCQQTEKRRFGKIDLHKLKVRLTLWPASITCTRQHSVERSLATMADATVMRLHLLPVPPWRFRRYQSRLGSRATFHSSARLLPNWSYAAWQMSTADKEREREERWKAPRESPMNLNELPSCRR